MTTRQTIPLGNTWLYFCMFAHNAFPLIWKIKAKRRLFYYYVLSNVNSFYDTHILNDEKAKTEIMTSTKEHERIEILINTLADKKVTKTEI